MVDMVGFFGAPVFWPPEQKKAADEFYQQLLNIVNGKDKPMRVEEIVPHQPKALTHFKVGCLYYHKPTHSILLCVTTRYGKAKDDNIRCIVIKPGPGVSNTNIGWTWIPRTVSNYELYNGTLTLINDQTGNS